MEIIINKNRLLANTIYRNIVTIEFWLLQYELVEIQSIDFKIRTEFYGVF